MKVGISKNNSFFQMVISDDINKIIIKITGNILQNNIRLILNQNYFNLLWYEYTSFLFNLHWVTKKRKNLP